MIANEMFHPGDFEEPELYESIKMFKEHLKDALEEVKETSKKKAKKEKERLNFTMKKRPFLNLEKMMKVSNTNF